MQKEILVDVNVEKSTLYRIVFRFVNQNPTTVMADVTLTPDVSIDENVLLLMLNTLVSIQIVSTETVLYFCVGIIFGCTAEQQISFSCQCV